MPGIRQLTARISGYHYRDLYLLMEETLIPEKEWQKQTAAYEFERLLERHLKPIRQSDTPKLTVVSGIPYSGKSTFIQKQNFSDSLILSFDRLMLELSHYKELSKVNKKLAFERCERIARVLGYELLHLALKKKVDIVFEHSSTPKLHPELYSYITDNMGYQLDFIYLNCSVETAKKRAHPDNPQRDEGRHTPPEYIQERHEQLQQLLHQYREITKITEISVS